MNIGRGHRRWLAKIMIAQKPAYPVEIQLFGPVGIMFHSQHSSRSFFQYFPIESSRIGPSLWTGHLLYRLNLTRGNNLRGVARPQCLSPLSVRPSAISPGEDKGVGFSLLLWARQIPRNCS